MDIIKRIKVYTANDEKFKYSYFATFINERKLRKMQRKAASSHLVEHFNSMTSGSIENASEKRMVLHHLLRKSSRPCDKVASIWDFYLAERDRCYRFARGINDGKIVSSVGEKYKYFVQVGFGGSILGARFLYEALGAEYRKISPDYKAIFIGNIDEQYIERQLDEIDLRQTLFIFATKSGGTKEVEIDSQIIQRYIDKHSFEKREGWSEFSLEKQSILLTSNSASITNPDAYFEKFYIDNNIGGRFSISSVMGLVINAIIYGSAVCDEFLSGMEYMDANAQKLSVRENVAMLSALMNYYEQKRYFIDQNIISPYSEGLRFFSEYLSQLFMESLGKDRNDTGKRIYTRTGQFFFGDRGIACQHSFYQMLHNGTASANIEFICFSDKPALMANCLAQSVSLYGRNKENIHRKVINKILYFDRYSAFNIGQIVSFYENKVMFLGFLYRINSYDQPGVEFGKRLYKELEKGENVELSELYEHLSGGKKYEQS